MSIFRQDDYSFRHLQDPQAVTIEKSARPAAAESARETTAARGRSATKL
jgi:hypothetical protein